MPDLSFLEHVQGAALDALTIGIIVADRCARVVYANDAARQILTPPSSALRLHGGRICSTRLTDHKNLGAVISWTCAAEAPAQSEYLLAPAGGSGAPDLAICVMPIAPRHASGHETNVMLVVRIIEQECNLEIEGRRLFGLTKTEARFASALASGLSLEDAARTFGVSPETARTHMKSIFRKTGVGRQSQVAALLRGIQLPVQPPRPWERPEALSA